MRAAFIADVPDWALHRQGLGLVKYGAIDGLKWDLLHVRPFDFSLEQVQAYDIVRIGSGGLVNYLTMWEHMPTKPTVICSLASFNDESAHRQQMQQQLQNINGFMAVDRRLLPSLEHFGLPSIAIEDRTDPDTFCPHVELRPRDGPLRVGWAGSTEYWPGVKGLRAIEEACKHTDGVTLVRQNRELDGLKSAEEMSEWYNSLDLYCVANIKDSPTPVPWLEAAACGVPVIGTVCGELYKVYHADQPWSRIRSQSAKDIHQALQAAVEVGRDKLHNIGLEFQKNFRYHLYWGEGEAQRFSRFAINLHKERT